MENVRGMRLKCGMVKSATPKDKVTASLAFKLKALRVRSGLSVAEVAKGLGYKSPAGYHRYEREANMSPKKRYITVEMAEDLWRLYKGRGEPPITEEEIMALAGQRIPSKTRLEALLVDLTDDQRDMVFTALLALINSLKSGSKPPTR
jgi:transcriptional regulator with XRE-family HTH domain